MIKAEEYSSANIINKTNLFLFIMSIILIILSYYNFLLFHSLVEFIAVVVSFIIFMIAVYSHDKSQNNFLLVLGIAYGFIGFFDLLHILAYKGMGVFTANTADLPTQLWIVARYLESTAILAALWFINSKKKFELPKVMKIMALISIIILFSLIFDFFPSAYLEGQGLTTFKIISEYLISAILLAAIYLLYQKKDYFEQYIYNLIFISLVLTILSEISFTFYVDVYGLSNITGHIFKLFSVILIFKAIIVSGFKKPYDFLYRELKLEKENVEEKKKELENKYQEVEELSKKFESIIYLTNRLSFTSKYNLRDFLTEILDISLDLINEADFGSISIFENNSWQLIEKVGYDEEILNELNDKRDYIFKSGSNIFKNDLIKVNNNQLDKYLNMDQIPEAVEEHINQISKHIKESIFFDIDYQADKKIRVSLDIAADSSSNFNQSDKKLLSAFRNMIYVFIKEYKFRNTKAEEESQLFED